MAVKWTDGNGPALAAAGKALGLTGTDDAIATQLRTEVAKYGSMGMSTFYENFTLKVLMSAVYDYMKYQSVILKAFYKGTTVSPSKEIVSTQYLKSEDYDKNKKMYDDNKTAQTLQTIFHTKLKKFIRNSVPQIGLRGAFATEQTFVEWMKAQTQLIAESFELEMQDYFKVEILKEIKNVITQVITVDKMDERFEFINKISLDMASNPTVKYNLGFTDPTHADNELKVKRHTTPRGNQYLLMHSDFKNKLDATGTIKFHNAYFKTEEYKGVLFADNLDMDTVGIVDEKCAEIYMRVTETISQMWAGNMTLETFYHFWILWGFIPWANGVLIKFK